MSRFTCSGSVSVIPKTSTGSVGGMDRRSPKKVVITASPRVRYHVSIPGRYITLGLWRLTSANSWTIAVSADFVIVSRRTRGVECDCYPG